MQQSSEKDSPVCHVLWLSVSVFFANWKRVHPYLVVFLIKWMFYHHLHVFLSSLFGVTLIIVDFVLVIVDLSLPAKSRDAGNALEAVSLTISFFFLADVLLRVYVEG